MLAPETLSLLQEHVLQLVVLQPNLLVVVIIKLAIGIKCALDDWVLFGGLVLLLSVLIEDLMLEALGLR